MKPIPNAKSKGQKNNETVTDIQKKAAKVEHKAKSNRKNAFDSTGISAIIYSKEVPKKNDENSASNKNASTENFAQLKSNAKGNKSKAKIVSGPLVKKNGVGSQQNPTKAKKIGVNKNNLKPKIVASKPKVAKIQNSNINVVPVPSAWPHETKGKNNLWKAGGKKVNLQQKVVAQFKRSPQKKVITGLASNKVKKAATNANRTRRKSSVKSKAIMKRTEKADVKKSNTKKNDVANVSRNLWFTC